MERVPAGPFLDGERDLVRTVVEARQPRRVLPDQIHGRPQAQPRPQTQHDRAVVVIVIVVTGVGVERWVKPTRLVHVAHPGRLDIHRRTLSSGTPEVGGLTTLEAQSLLRGLRGLDLIGGDVVEVAPPFDPTGNTALVAATMMYEILCPLAEAVARRKGR